MPLEELVPGQGDPRPVRGEEPRGEASGWPIDTGPVYSKSEDPDPDTPPRDPDFVRILHDMAPRESGS